MGKARLAKEAFSLLKAAVETVKGAKESVEQVAKSKLELAEPTGRTIPVPPSPAEEAKFAATMGRLETLGFSAQHEEEFQRIFNEYVSTERRKFASVFRALDDIASNPDAREFVNKEMIMLGITPSPKHLANKSYPSNDVFSPIFDAPAKDGGGIRGVYNAISEKINERAQNNFSLLYQSQARRRVGDEQVDKILSDPNLTTQEKNAKIFNIVLADQDAKNAIMKEDRKGVTDMMAEGFGTILHHIDDSIHKLREMNMPEVSAVMRDIYNFMSRGAATRYRIVNLLSEGNSILKKKGEQKAAAIRAYIESEKPNLQEISYGNAGIKIEADKDAIEAVSAKYGVTLDADDIMFANRLSNTFRLASRILEQQGSLGRYDSPAELASDFMSMEGRRLFDRSIRYGRHDFGPDYYPRTPTVEYLRMIKNDKKVALELESYGEDEWKKQTFFLRHRNPNSQWYMDDTKRLKPWEEVDNYIRQYRGYLHYRIGKDKFQQAKSMLAIRNLNDRQRQPIYELIAAPERFFDDTYKSHNWRSKSAKIYNMISSALVASALKNPAMALLNSLVTIQNGAQYHGFLNSLAATAEAGIKMLWYAPKNLFDIRKAWQDIANNEATPQMRKMMRRIVAEEPETRYFFDEDAVSELSEMSRFFGNIMGILTKPFEASDRIGRTATVYAAYRHIERAANKFFATAERGDVAGAQKELFKDLHLGAFHEVPREEIMTLFTNALRESGSKRAETINEAYFNFIKYSVDSENFVYTKQMAPRVVAWMRAQSPALANVVTFASYQMHYANLLRGAWRAAKNGDKVPLMMIGVYGLAWYAFFKSLEATDEDVLHPLTYVGLHPAQFGRYASFRGPGMAVVQIPEFAMRPIGGLVGGLWEIPEWMLLKTFDKMADAPLDRLLDIRDNNSFDWALINLERDIFKKSLPSRDIRNIMKNVEEFRKQMEVIDAK